MVCSFGPESKNGLFTVLLQGGGCRGEDYCTPAARGSRRYVEHIYTYTVRFFSSRFCYTTSC